jgi:hypothetical protein
VPSSQGDYDLHVCVTNPSDSLDFFRMALNAAATIPMPIDGRWTVDAGALKTAFIGGTKLALTPTTT